MMEALTLGIIAVGAVLLGLAALIGIFRIVRGPSSLDRVVATDLLVAIVVGGIGLWMVVSHRSELLLVLLLLSLVGYTGAASVARLVGEKVELRRREGDEA